MCGVGLLPESGTGEVADWAGDDRYLVPFTSEVPCQFMVAGAAGFIHRREGLVDQQDVHIVNNFTR